MKKIVLLILLTSISLTSFTQNFSLKWENGFKLSSTDGNFNLKFGGRIMYDFACWSSTDSTGEIKKFNGTEFRRVRFFNSGQVYNNIKYKLQLDFSGGKISFKDVYIEIIKIPVIGNLKMGHFKEPLRLEALTSSKYITLMERALPFALSPERNVGFMLHRTFIDDKFSLQAGIFKNASSNEGEIGNDEEANGNRNITSRMTYLAINQDDNLLHLGVSFSNRINADNIYSSSTRAENNLGNKLVKVSINDVASTNILGTEIAFNIGPFSIQSEYLNTMLNRSIDSLSNHTFSGYYTQLSYFLTGEKRKYKNSLAGFDQVKPTKNFGDGGIGAIELATRYSSIDFTSANGGRLNDISLELNWYLNPCTRIMFNYILGSANHNAEVSEYEKENTFQCRIQIDF